jgi:hypothetical protein
MSVTALTHAAPAPAFNGLFYTTAATIIPVLFLALAVQGNAYANLLKAFSDVSAHPGHTWPWYRKSAAIIASGVLLPTAYLIVVFGAYSEVVAVYALYQQQADPVAESGVLIGTVFMVIATVAGPAFAFLRALLTSLGLIRDVPRNARKQQRTAEAHDPGSAQSPQPGGAPGTQTPPEPDETGTDD